MGRGSSKLKGVKYGTEFKTVLDSGNIKFIKFNGKNAPPPDYTEVSGRVYVLVNRNNKLKSIIYFDSENKRRKQIDLDHRHNGMGLHTHHGYRHNENDGKKGASNLTQKEKDMVDRVKELWYTNGSK